MHQLQCCMYASVNINFTMYTFSFSFIKLMMHCIILGIDYKLNEINDQQEMIANSQGWNSHDIMIPVPIKMQPPLMLDQNNLQIPNQIPHQNVLHTSPQAPHVNV